MYKILGIKKKRTTTFHPQSNGMVEPRTINHLAKVVFDLYSTGYWALRKVWLHTPKKLAGEDYNTNLVWFHESNKRQNEKSLWSNSACRMPETIIKNVSSTCRTCVCEFSKRSLVFEILRCQTVLFLATPSKNVFLITKWLFQLLSRNVPKFAIPIILNIRQIVWRINRNMLRS